MHIPLTLPPNPATLKTTLEISRSVSDHLFISVETDGLVGFGDEFLQEELQVPPAGYVDRSCITERSAGARADESGGEVKAEAEEEGAAPDVGAEEGAGGGDHAFLPGIVLRRDLRLGAWWWLLHAATEELGCVFGGGGAVVDGG